MTNKILFISGFLMLFVQCSKEGCSDVNALNYDSKVTKDDGSCVYVGCNDPDAFNYNPIASSDSIVCIYEGCTDSVAVNYNPKATISTECIYNNVGSWNTTKQEYIDSTYLTSNGVIIPNTNTTTTTTTPTDSLSPNQIDFYNNGTIISYYPSEPIHVGNWSILSDNLSFELNDTSLVMKVDTVNSVFLRLIGVSTDTIIINSVSNSLTTRHSIFEFSRN